jgi:SAM-dependent methyltransferase
MAWYEDWFDKDEYELLYQSRDAVEAVQLADLVERHVQPGPGSRLLDMGCGRGRHAIEFAGRGYDITGVDLSERSIAQAKKLALHAGLEIDFRRADMRVPLTGTSFDGVLNLFTAFGYFETMDENQAAINAMISPLRADGFFVQDFLNADRVISDMVPEDYREIGNAKVTQKRRIENNRIKKEIIFSVGDQTHTFNESVALLSLDDFKSMYEVAGLELTDVMGSYLGEPFTPDSSRMILFSRKRAQ